MNLSKHFAIQIVVGCLFLGQVTVGRTQGYVMPVKQPQMIPAKLEMDDAFTNGNILTMTASNQNAWVQLDLQTKRAATDYAKKYYEYQSENLTTVQGEFKWNRIQSVVIFVVAHMLLVIGIFAAAWEFTSACKLRKNARAQNEIRVDLEGIALKTSLRAIWLLLSAFVFYFLYIRFVYPITLVQ